MKDVVELFSCHHVNDYIANIKLSRHFFQAAGILRCFTSLALSYGSLPLTDTKRKKLIYICHTHSPVYPHHSPGRVCVTYIGKRRVFWYVKGTGKEPGESERSEALNQVYMC